MMRAVGAFAALFLVTVGAAPAAPVSKAELARFKLKRRVANDFMRQAAGYAIERLKKEARPEGEAKIKYLQGRLAAPNYFRGGTKTDDLLDCLLWAREADRLGIMLSDRDLQGALEKEVSGRLDDEAHKRIEEMIRRKYPEATAAFIRDALRDEFRVRLARKALLGEGGGGKAGDKKP
jgi:hypothetical protein